MSERDSPVDGIERRGVLAALATGLGGVGLARSSLARRVDAQDTSRFVVEQGDRCIPITPLSGDETVEELYDYRTPYTSPSGEAYSSYGTTDLQRPETSICFLYDGPEGVSLVVVHDELEDGTNGGSVTFRFDGLTGGSWVVGDDDYDAPSNYDNFAETAEGWQVDWTWAESRSDGGAYRPLGDDFAVTIDPAFNEAAELYGDPYEGEITDWQVLSGDRSDLERVSLALDQPLTIRAGGCGGTTTTTTRETTDEQETTTEEDATEEEQETTEEETTEEEAQETTEETEEEYDDEYEDDEYEDEDDDTWEEKEEKLEEKREKEESKLEEKREEEMEKLEEKREKELEKWEKKKEKWEDKGEEGEEKWEEKKEKIEEKWEEREEKLEEKWEKKEKKLEEKWEKKEEKFEEKREEAEDDED